MSSDQMQCEPDREYFEALIRSLDVEGYEDQALAAAREARDGAPVACWAYRGCSGLMGLTEPMEEECPHSRHDCYSPCPAECGYTACSRPWHRSTTDINLIFDETVDRMAALKKNCYTCSYFLTHGPRIGEGEGFEAPIPDTATKDSESAVTIHLF